MNCPRCNQPMHSSSWRHRDGHTDTKHTCRNHLCRYRWQERCDATPQMVAAMRAEGRGGHGRFDQRARAATFDSSSLPPGGRYLTTEQCAEVMRRVDASGWQTAKADLPRHTTTIVDEQMPIVHGILGKIRTEVHIAEPSIIGHTSDGTPVCGVPRKWLPPDANGIEWTARMPRDGDKLPAAESQREQFIELVQWFARMHVGEAETLWILAARHMLTVSVGEIVAFIERELPKLRAGAAGAAPKPPREVKVGDVLLNAAGQSARKVLGIERGRLLLCYCGNGVDESVATASYLLDDVKPLGWTFADTGEAV